MISGSDRVRSRGHLHEKTQFEKTLTGSTRHPDNGLTRSLSFELDYLKSVQAFPSKQNQALTDVFKKFERADLPNANQPFVLKCTD
jgi:hypothetical protein